MTYNTVSRPYFQRVERDIRKRAHDVNVKRNLRSRHDGYSPSNCGNKTLLGFKTEGWGKGDVGSRLSLLELEVIDGC
jgi:hypothetical protein